MRLPNSESSGGTLLRLDSLCNLSGNSGRFAAGTIAYVEDHFFVWNEKNRRHLLKTIKVDGSEDTTLFSRPGDAMWASTREKGEIGRDLALSPTGGQVAFLSDLAQEQMPDAL